MKIVILGGAGYVGTELCKFLTDKEISKTCEILVLDTFWFFDTETFAKQFPNIKFAVWDIRGGISRFITSDTVVINLACLSNDSVSDIDPALTWDISYNGVMTVIDDCLKAQCRLIHISTTNVYGNKAGKYVDEDDTEDPITLYSKIKTEIDHYLKFLFKKDKLNGMILRPGTLYGISPNMRADIVIHTFAKKIQEDGSIFVHGGDQRRPFLCVSDLARIIYFCRLAPYSYRLINIVSSNFSINEIVSLLRKRKEFTINRQWTSDMNSFQVKSRKFYNFAFDEGISTIFFDVDDKIDEILDFKEYSEHCVRSHSFKKLINLSNV